MAWAKSEEPGCPGPFFSATAKRKKVPDTFFLAILLAVALAIGVYLIATGVLISKDGVFYIEQAQRLTYDPLGAARRYPIGYPFLLLAGHKVADLFADGDRAVVWAGSSQAVTLLCRMGALVFLYLLGRILVGARRSFWAVLILTVLPYPAHYGSDVLREWPFLLFLAAGFWLLLWALRGGPWWLFGLIGLDAGLGYLIRPMCGQLVIYGLLGLLVAPSTGWGWPSQRGDKPWVERTRAYLLGPAVLLLLGFAVVVVPYFVWTGTAVPHQFRPITSNTAPVITALGGRSASDVALSFEVRAGEPFEATIEASDPDGDALAISAVAIPSGAQPVYRFRSGRQTADFWTISEREKDALLTYPHEVWAYEGIDYYAYAKAGAASGLSPVYRLWSAVLDRHFFTVSASEREALLAAAPQGQWQSEGVAFYAFALGDEPAGAVPVYRFRNADGQCFWSVEDTEAATKRLSGDRLESDGIVWYVQAARPLPANAALEGTTFRWRPESHQEGQRQFNVIVSDGRLQSCQLMRVAVGKPAERAELPMEDRRADEAHPVPVAAPRSERTPRGLVSLLAAGEILKGVNENLMIFFFVPLCLGLYHRLRIEAGPQERVLTIAVLATNVALMLGRNSWFESGSVRRYSLGLIVLTVCYIPTGLERMARGLRMALDCVLEDRGRPELGEKVWFYALLAIGAVLCAPKLLTPMGAEKQGYRQTVLWLRDNTRVDDVIAVPDRRISFYAERRGPLYRDHADPRKADYVVALVSDDSPSRPPEDWRRRYACRIDPRRRAKIVVYQMP